MFNVSTVPIGPMSRTYPHKCPCCDGFGRRTEWSQSTSGWTTQICVSCNGRGIVWEPETPLVMRTGEAPAPPPFKIAPMAPMPMPVDPMETMAPWYPHPPFHPRTTGGEVTVKDGSSDPAEWPTAHQS